MAWSSVVVGLLALHATFSQEDDKLIEAVAAHPAVFDLSHVLYKDQPAKDIWVDVAEEVGKTVSGVFDVTTIYHIGSIYNDTKDAETVEVHLRTNARGLPINYGGRQVDDAIIGRYFPTCNHDRKNCPWKADGWKWDFENQAFGYKDNFIATTITLKKMISEVQPLPEEIKVQLRGYFCSSNIVRFVILPHEATRLRNFHQFYVIDFHGSNNGYNSYIRHCHKVSYYSNMVIYDRNGESVNAECSETATFRVDNWSYSDKSAVNTFVLDTSDGKIQLWSDSEKTNKVLDFVPSTPIEANYFTMIYLNDYYNIMASFESNSVLRPNGSDPLVSPWFTADIDQLCIALVVKGSRTVDLNVTAENTEQESFELGNIFENFFREESMKVLHFTSPVPEELKGSKIRLLLTPNTEDTFTIQRISSCNGQEGDVAVLNLEKLKAKGLTADTAFDVDMNKRLEYEFLHGVESECPPGFSGWRCDRACGRNRFGKDCNGVCSMYTSECQGLRLCTPTMGCHCAPGYYGELCEDQCETGKYGNDCNQDCGHCDEQSSCDIYTGHCVSCESGYYPPYCKETYPVVVNAPEIRTTSFQSAVVSARIDDYSGSSKMYQIQYRESGTGNWTIHESSYYNELSTPSLFDSSKLQYSSLTNEHSTINGLSCGRLYDVRFILFDDNLNSYQGDEVPYSTFLSHCTIPFEVDYHIISSSNTTSVSFSWDYNNTTDCWCPSLHYEVTWKEGWKWIKKNTTDSLFSLSNLLSGRNITFKVRAYTASGFAPYSDAITITTKLKVPGPVRRLTSQHKDSAEVISWGPPEDIGRQPIKYNLKYQCRKRLACNTGCEPANSLEVQVSNTNETLYSLLPFTQYLVTVSAGEGLKTSIVLGTKMSAPTEIVKSSSVLPLRTNNSVTVFWEPVDVCSGFLKGYVYQFYKADDMSTIIYKDFTKNTHVTIKGLSPKTEYSAQIFIETVAGWVADKYLLINISTSATVPEQVQNLTVYKRGRNLLSLRWEEPRKLYGVLKHFTITYGHGKDNRTETILPTPCVAWPHLYCHTLDNLIPNRRYTVSVSAKNAEVPEDGAPSLVTEITKEGTAGVPENVEVVNTTSTSFAVTWKYPSLANGIIRSFLMSVEETEQYESDKCCQIYPLVETAVKEELPNYTVEVSGLHPASTYTVSLSAKTVSFGPSVTLTIYTQPPSMPLRYLPKVNTVTEQQLTWLPQRLLQNINNTDIYQPLIKANILLVVLNSSSSDFNTGIENEKLAAELKKVINTDYYLAAEYLEADMTTIGTGESVQTRWGTLNNPSLTVGVAYSLAAVQVSEYCGVYNVDIVFSSTFTAAAQR